jgi:hypothetical protein
MRILRGLGTAIVVLVGLAVVVAAGARCADGPVGVLAGGALRAGEWVAEPVADWGFAADVETIEFQLLEPARSRTVWIAVHGGRAYVPCGFLQVPLWKQWPHEALADGRAVLRIEGRRYPVQAVRVEEHEEYAAVARVAAAKYGFGAEGTPSRDQVWIFRMDPRAASEP